MRVSILSILVTALACGGARPEAATLPRAESPPKPHVVWPRFAEVNGWPASGVPFANAGHVGAGASAVVRVNPEARSAYEHLVKDTELPDGTVVALFHELAPNRPGAVYVMEKADRAWRFSAWRPDGSALAPVPSTEGCRRCHADGVADSLFGLPRRPPSIP